MKYLKIALSGAVAFVALSAQAESSFRFEPYVGAQYQHVSLKYKTVNGIDFGDFYADGLNDGAIYLGARIHDNFGVELGYGRTGEEKKDTMIRGLGLYRSTMKLQSFTVDVLGYLPLDAAKKFDLIGSIGFARTQAKITVRTTPKSGNYDYDAHNETRTDLRLGLGAQYEAFENFRVRGMMHWENTRFNNGIDKAYVLSLGFNYSF